MRDIRQSENWGKYLESLGWKYEKVEDIFVFIKSIGFGSVIKIQRPEKLTPKKIKAIDELALKNKALFVKCEPAELPDTENLLKNGYKRSFFPLVCPSTVIMDLTKSEEELLRNLKKDVRQSIRKAKEEKLETKFYINATPEKQKEAWELLTKTGKEKKFYVQPFSDFESKVKIWGEDSIIVTTYKDGEILAASLVLLFDENAFYTHAGTNLKGREVYASYQQLWETILYLKKLKIKKFDLEGINDERFPNFTRNWGGFSLFKLKFGGEVLKMPAPYIKYYSKLLTAFSKFAGELPL